MCATSMWNCILQEHILFMYIYCEIFLLKIKIEKKKCDSDNKSDICIMYNISIDMCSSV